MKVLMLVNWKVEHGVERPSDRQPPDYYIKGEMYWFYRYFKQSVEVDVIDISSFPWLERFEKEKLRFYVVQALRAIPKLWHYDLVVSHGMQSAVVLSLFRRLFPMKTKHVVFEIGSFNSATESGAALKLMQFASKSIDGFIYHTSGQKEYYKRFFPWIVGKSRFIPFGTDADFFSGTENEDVQKSVVCESRRTIICVGYAKRDWDTLYQAFCGLQKDERIEAEERECLRLKLIGNPSFQYENDKVEVMPYIPIKRLIEEIENAHFCVVPLKELNYSFGQMTLLQQMALGKAVIASKVSSLKDYIKDRETALFYEPESAEELEDRMKELLLNAVLRDTLGRNARISVKDRFNEERMAEDIEEYFHMLCKS